MTCNIVKEQWEEFRRLVMHPDSPPIQVTEMRNAFYAGTHMMLLKIVEIANERAIEGAMQKLNSIQKEIEDYAEMIRQKESQDKSH